MSLTVFQIAEKVGGEVLGNGDVILTGFSAAGTAREGDLTFAEKESYFEAAEKSQASAILLSGPFTSPTKAVIRVPNARVAMAKLLPIFFPPDQFAPGIHPTATIADSAQIDSTAHIGPHVFIGDNARVGARSALLSGSHLGHDSHVGDDVRLHPNVVIYPGCRVGNRVSIHASTVIGADGYSYTFDAGRHLKVLQLGNVVIDDDVEIGANTAIDRGALGSTRIGQGTKIDNLVHIAHNVTIGKHCLIMGQVGFAGSTTLEDYCVIASQAGIAGHLTIGAQTTLGARTGVMRDIPPKSRMLGAPAIPDRQEKRQWIAIQQLPDLIRRVREMEKTIADLTAKLG